MAIYHLTAKTIARASGRSAVAAAAYRCGMRLVNERDGLAHDFRARSGVVSTFIVAPDAAPAWALDRQALWSAAEIRETRLNAVTAREWEAALPDELDAGQREALARQFAAAMVERFGLVADCAIHAPGGDGDQRNHHLHMLTTTRAVAADGLGAKTRALDDRKSGAVEGVRALWETLTNHALEAAQRDARVDRRSLKAQAADAAQEAARATESAEKAGRSLNPIGKRKRVQKATESAQEARQRAEALSRPPTTHQGPQRTAQRRKEARAEAVRVAREKRLRRIVDALVEIAGRARLQTVSSAGAEYEAAAHKVFDCATDFLDDMLFGVGVAAWVKGFVGRGGWIAKVFSKRLTDAGLIMNSMGREVAGDELEKATARLIKASDKWKAVVAWSAAAAEYEGPRLQHEDERLEASRRVWERMQRENERIRNAINRLEDDAARLFCEALSGAPNPEGARDLTRHALRRSLNGDFNSRVWPERVQEEFERVTALSFLAPAPEPEKPAPPPGPKREPEAPVPPPYRRPSGPSM